MSGKTSSDAAGTTVIEVHDPLPAFRLNLLGAFTLRDAAGQELPVSSRKNRALLAILALSPKLTCTRERLSTLLWGDHGEEQARSSLRQSLTALRRDVGSEQLVQSQDDLVSLDEAMVSIDAHRILAWDDRGGLQGVRHAAEAWTGELLQDVSLRDGSFDDWLRSEREKLKATATRLFARLCELETGSLRIDAAKRLVLLDPLSENSQRQLMRAHAGQGDKGLALKQYEDCRALLRAELQVEPAQETQALRQLIASGDFDRAAPEINRRDPPSLPAGRSADRPSIAVLPFDNANADQDQLFLSDGISDDIITSLSQFRSLTVIARSSSFAFRGRAASEKQIGRELGVRFLLHGTVRRAAQQLRVTAELIDAENDATLWAQKFDRSVEDVFEVIDDLSSAIVASTIGRIEDEILRKARQKPPELFAAYELVLRGRMLMHQPGWPAKLAARQLFEDALALDPGFVMAKVQLALTHLQEFFFDDSGSALDLASEIAAEALQLDEEEPWCHMVLGLTHLHRRRFALAVQHAERAVALNSNDPKLVAKLGLVLTDVGRPEDAIALIQRAMKLTPLSPEDYNDYLALAYFGARRYREAEQALLAFPDRSYYTHVWQAAIAVRLGDATGASRHRDEALRLSPGFTVGRVAAMEPLQRPEDLAHWIETLTAAGFPP